MGAALLPVGPGVPTAVAPVLKSHEDAIHGLQQPLEPSAILTVTVAKLPDVTAYRSHIVIVSDYPALAFSDGAHWYRADTGGVIV